VGLEDGEVEGLADGSSVGRPATYVGTILGCALGTIVGEKDGPGVGLPTA